MSVLVPNVKPLHYRILTPLRDFINDSRATGVILIGCTILSILLANSGTFGEGYRHFWTGEIVALQGIMPSSLVHFVNDFLMSFFFLLAGMEIKRELVSGEL